LTEALRQGGRIRGEVQSLIRQSSPAANGVSTVLLYQKLGREIYLDDACFATDATIQLENPCAR
jgi:hypothetical protein